MNLKEKYDTISNPIEYQEFLLNKETLEKNDSSNFDYLYPSLNDPEFNLKIAQKKEFNDMKYDGEIEDPIAKAEKLCNAEFELAPHQLFVRNFLSFNTPYNSLLLYHGLGTGKTCSAITVSEEMRDYMKQMGFTQRIIIVASPNVQENFRLQLFDERKLKLVNGVWNIQACTGNKYLREINPTNIKGISKNKIIRQVTRIINNYYLFIGYTEFSNYIVKQSLVEGDGLTKSQIDILRRKKLKKIFDNRLIVIDEVHNLRNLDDSKTKGIAKNLSQLVKTVDGLRLLLLSATPMYNSYKEIIWLINLMNANDDRAQINIKEVFDRNGDFIISDTGEEIGKELLIQKATGYVSFIRGENPYTFPYRIFPKQFAPEKSIFAIEYPKLGLNKREIIQSIEHLDLFTIGIGSYQNEIYKYILTHLEENLKGKVEFENMEKFGYTLLQYPLEALNICYPIDGLGEPDFNVNPSALVGNLGLKRIMKFKETTQPPQRFDFEYRQDILDKFGKIFTPNEIGKYSLKIKSICESIEKSEGIILIYSQFIDGGLVPLALAIEEMGFRRYGNAKSLLKNKPSNISKNPPKYAMITGDKLLSPNNLDEIKALTGDDNKNGEKVKVVFISKAGSEGLDFKNIRQVHILEPWYNTNRIEQIIGRAVRTCSHKKLPFSQRNVMIYLYGTLLPSGEEAADMYVYRLADLKAMQIGRVSRVLKQSAIDCLLNHSQTNFTEDKMKMEVTIHLSNKKDILFKIGDKPFSSACDYMETCDYSCYPKNKIGEVNEDSYNETYLLVNNDKITKRIKGLFKEKYFYKLDTLISEINLIRNYPLMEIYAALDQLVNDNNEFLIDRYNRSGRLVNIGDYYFFQPIELESSEISLHDRRVPINFKRKNVVIPLEIKPKEPPKEINIIDTIQEQFLRGTSTSDKDTDWYSYSKRVIDLISETERSSDIEQLNRLVLNHILESLSSDDKLKLLNIIYFKDDLSEFEIEIKNYFDKQLLKDKKLVGIFLLIDKKYSLFILKPDSWKKAEPEELKDLAEEVKKQIEGLIINMAMFVGYMSQFKEKGMVFKIKDTTSKRKKGARCDQSGKSNVISIINMIVGEDRFTRENTDQQNITELCVYQELILRYYNEINEKQKKWFLTPEQANIISI